MAYSDFSIEEVIDNFKLTMSENSIFKEKIEKKLIKDDYVLKDRLSKAMKSPLNSEKARSEALIYPILFEVQEKNNKDFLIHSGENLNIDKDSGLNGECDFIISRGVQIIISPIISIVEAKRNDIELGLGQCIAQMVGANLFNQKKKNKIKIIYGAVTTGTEWKFLKLENNNITIDLDTYFINRVDKILTIFKMIIDESEV